MIDPQTEARAIAWEVHGAQLHRVFLDEAEARELASRFKGAVTPLVHATALSSLRQEIAAKDAELAAREDARAEQWRLRRDAEASRDVARAACDSMRIERDEALSNQDDGLAWDALALCKKRAERAEAHLAEANKALDEIIERSHNDPLGTSKVNDMREIARRAREAQGGSA